uniref:Uncharacterized protein n=1 Tax=Heterorhabditis bacteriophora TaxID=37862 RepID=A0A1I7WSI5_HETBA
MDDIQIEDEDDWNDGIIGHGSYRHVVSEVEVPNDGESKANMNNREHSDSTCYHNISMQSTSRPIGYTQTNSNVPGTVRFRSMRTLSDIHKQRRPIPSLRSGAYMGRNMRLAKACLLSICSILSSLLQSPVEVVEYVDTGEYHGEGHIVEMVSFFYSSYLLYFL